MIADAVAEALRSLLRTLFSPIKELIETHAGSLLQLLVGTPAPTTIFGTPRTLPWIPLYEFYWETIVPLALLLFGVAVGLVILLETTSHLFSSYHRTNLKRRAFSGLLGVLSWWWLSALSLQLTDQLVTLLLPNLSSVTLFETASFTGIGLLGLVASLSIDALLFGLLGLVYLGRRLLLYGFVLGMPLLMVAWIPGVGPFALLSRFAKRLAGFYVPFLVLPVPVALLLRLGDLLGDAATLSMGGFGAWLTALVLPFVAIIAPFILVWQAGGLLFVGERLGRRVSRERLRARTARGRDLGRRVRDRGEGTARTLRDRTPVAPVGRASSGAETGSGGGTRLQRGLSAMPGRLGDRFTSDDGAGDAEGLAGPTWEATPFEPADLDTTSTRDTLTDDRTDE